MSSSGRYPAGAVMDHEHCWLFWYVIDPTLVLMIVPDTVMTEGKEQRVVVVVVVAVVVVVEVLVVVVVVVIVVVVAIVVDVFEFVIVIVVVVVVVVVAIEQLEMKNGDNCETVTAPTKPVLQMQPTTTFEPVLFTGQLTGVQIPSTKGLVVLAPM